MAKAGELLQAIERGVSAAKPAPSAADGCKTNLRADQCSIAGCVHQARAKGLCNAHYLRARSGAAMDAPVRRLRSTGAECQDCSSPVGPKGAWGRCGKHYRRERSKVIKLALIEAMGGLCADCGGSFHHAAFDFHHLGDKDGSVSGLMNTSSLDQVAAEAAKCELLCANCHRIRHANEDRD